ncbi:MAG: triose-phosphate isomerase [Bacteroidetes bacterium]|nr:triose-phosphate isomerase [Bacteroidota bacterium]
MRKKIVAGNWKMNGLKTESESLINEIISHKTDNGVIKIICPPYIYLEQIKHQTKHLTNFFIGAQNCSHQAKGAFTGEISAAMIHSIGCEYVIIGHSERRTLFNESNQLIAQKINLALTENLNVIFCYGETLAEREKNTEKITVETQIREGLQNIEPAKYKNIILAYEPVWAIGTGLTATPHQAQEMHQFSRSIISKIADESIAQETSILYGGSCNAANAKELFMCPDVDGGLIGGASLKSLDFCTIINSF